MNFFMTGSAQGYKTVKMFKLLSDNRNTIYFISFVMHFQRVGGAANPAFMPIP